MTATIKKRIVIEGTIQEENKWEQQTTNRISPQLSCTIASEDKEKLNALTLYLSNKKGKALNTSTIIRSLIRLGECYKDELEA
jgi:hypothetical protein